MRWRLGVVGYPVAHSLTPAMHRAALEALGMTGVSTAFEIGADDSQGLDRALASVDALSVTMPFKTTLRARCSTVDDAAQRVGAVNSLWVRDGRVCGRSTDGIGFLDALRTDFGDSVTGRTVVVMGAGGAARSIVDACWEAGAHLIAVRARAETAAESLAARYDRVIANPPYVSDVALVVNAIVGGEIPDLPACDVRSAPDAVAIDIAYHPACSAWLAEQARAGLRTANGLSMLVHQARHQLEWWFERPVPVEPLWAAVGR